MWGLVALVAVATLIGGILGGGVFVASRALGLSGGGGTTEETSGSGGGETMIIPTLTDTDRTPTDYITLRNVPEPPLPSSTYSDSPDASGEITLRSAQTSVAPLQTIDLSGTYNGADDGTSLQVQRFENGDWQVFDVTATVYSGEFSTYVQTGLTGENKFRVIDLTTDTASNDVVIDVG